jgi:hypothetical protein
MSELEIVSYENLVRQLADSEQKLKRVLADLDHACDVGELCPKCFSRFRRDPKRSRGFIYLNCPNPNCFHQTRKDIENANPVSQ